MLALVNRNPLNRLCIVVATNRLIHARLSNKQQATKRPKKKRCLPYGELQLVPVNLLVEEDEQDV